MGRFADSAEVRRALAAGQDLERDEIIFAVSIVGLAVVVGIVRPGNGVVVHILLVLWSGLIGLMIPRIRAAHQRTVDEPDETEDLTVRHDIAAALLMIEGGVTAMRYMDRDGRSDKLETIAHAIETEIRRIRRLSSCRSEGEPCACITETILPLVELHVANGARISTRFANPPSVVIAPDDLARVFANLFDNCARHAPGAEITVEGYRCGSNYEIMLRDDGPGIHRDIRGRVSEVGVSTRPGGGLGLYSVRAMVEGAGGRVKIASSELGTLVLVTLQTADERLLDLREPALSPPGAA